MSKKLTSGKNLKGASAVAAYRRDNSGSKKKRVIVKNNGNIIFNDEILVTAGDYGNYFSVDIMWENVKPDYKEIGLYGSYSSNYKEITYDDYTLSIYSDDIVINIM